uniref:Uncharacterized protein n=1 Tax=Mesocestoides corti TaxID=53468 RepID=A0A5K3G7P8_MESCO
MRSNYANRTPALSHLWSTQAKTLQCQLNLSWRSSDIQKKWIHRHCPGLGLLSLK